MDHVLLGTHEDDVVDVSEGPAATAFEVEEEESSSLCDVAALSLAHAEAVLLVELLTFLETQKLAHFGIVGELVVVSGEVESSAVGAEIDQVVNISLGGELDSDEGFAAECFVDVLRFADGAVAGLEVLRHDEEVDMTFDGFRGDAGDTSGFLKFINKILSNSRRRAVRGRLLRKSFFVHPRIGEELSLAEHVLSHGGSSIRELIETVEVDELDVLVVEVIGAAISNHTFVLEGRLLRR